jgi:CheY-like chemotaxis protein
VQILVNLLNNAAKYTPDGGEIAIDVAREGSEAVVRVKDNGVGIPPEKLNQIFDLFTQLDFGTERAQGGLGIGLTLVRRLVELHGGSISVTSLGVGKGSEFVVRLPSTPECPAAAAPDGEGAIPAGSRHIVIVEDNHDGRESLAMLLDLLGHRVNVAEDGPKGLEAILALRPEIALIDIGLPGMDGYELARKARAALGEGVVLVALTGYGLPEDRQQAMEAGFNSFLLKPVDLAALQQLLTEHSPPA